MKMIHMFRALRSRNYRLFFAGQGLSLIGTWVQKIATPWLVYKMTGSVLMLGIVGFTGQIPTFIIAPFAGVVSDRVNKYRIMIITQILSLVQAAMLAFLFLSHSIRIWQIIALNILLGCINAFDIPARQAFMVRMVDRKEDLGNAIALNSSMVNGARLIGPSIAGIMISITNEGICFLINAISFIFVIISLLMMNVKMNKVRRKVTTLAKELKEGFSYTFGFAPVAWIIMLLGLISLMGMPYTVLMPVFAKKILQGGPHTFGFLMGSAGLGALTGALFLASRKNLLGLERFISNAAIIFGAGVIAFALSRNFFLSMFFLFIAGFGMIVQHASSNTIVQTITDEDKRGRVMSFYTMAFMGTAPFGSLIAGGLASLISAPFTLIFGGACCIVGGIIFSTRIPTIRKLIHPIYVKLGIIPAVASGIQNATDLNTGIEE